MSSTLGRAVREDVNNDDDVERGASPTRVQAGLLRLADTVRRERDIVMARG